MKYKFIALTLIFASAFSAINAQEKEDKKHNNVYIGAGIGAMSVLNDGMNSPTFNMNVKIGKYITPVWGVRAEIAGAWQSLEKQEYTGYQDYCKMFGEVNLDATLSLTNLFLNYDENRMLNLYAFAGPTMNIASAVSGKSEMVTIETENGYKVTTSNPTFETHGTKARFGATVGLGLDFNLNKKWALNVESRFGVTPSIFGEGSDCRKAEATGRLTIGATYTFGGKKFVKGCETKIIEKEVIKEVTREVPVEVVKEVVKEIPGAASAAIFFKIGKAVISPEGMVNVKLMAKVMKENPNVKYTVAGFADKGTGSADANMKLSEKRAQAVYDALVSLGISPERLEKKAMGGTDPMFEKAYLNRVVILETK